MVAPDRMVMGNGAAVLDHGIEACRFYGVPLRAQLAVTAGGVEGEIRRRPVRVDVGNAAGDLSGTPGRLDNRTLGRGLDLVVEGLEPLPGDGGLERIVDDAALHG